MKTLTAVDDYLVDAFQTAYLWLLDRTGIYVGSVMFLTAVADHVCFGPLKPLDFAALAFYGAWSTYLFIMQSKSLRQINDFQRSWRDMSIRRYSIVLVIAFLVRDVVQLNPWHFASDVFWLAWNYWGCVQIRDREPKDFFSVRKFAGAGA